MPAICSVTKTHIAKLLYPIRSGVGAIVLMALTASHAVSQVAVEIRLADDTILGPNAPVPAGRLPVLFVHGHKPSFPPEPDPNYVINWQDPRNDTSFRDTFELVSNNDLDIEAYYVNFTDQGRSILEDANAIGLAVEKILNRHDPGYDLSLPIDQRSTAVQVAIVAYSKGTISSRLYLKSLAEPLVDLPAAIANLPPADRGLVSRPGFHPVSEFIAISPPNHGLKPNSFFGGPASTATKQLYNGFDESCVAYDTPSVPWVTDFFASLNGFALSGAAAAPATDRAGEAPGSRPDGSPPHTGTLYLALYAADETDFVGGQDPPTDDCQDRGHARNLADDAVSIEVGGISGGTFNTSVEVHRNSVHHPDVICAALYTIVHHRTPAGALNSLCTLNNGVPVIPLPARASVGLVLDFSGSMILPACPNPGCTQRHQVLKDATEIFMTLWSLLGSDPDQTSITLFRNSAALLDDNGQVLLPLPASGNVGSITGLFSSEAPSGSTAMGQGLASGIGSLASVTGVRRLLLVTDGLQNVQPLVEEQAGGYAVASASPLDLSDTGIPIDTIAIGDGAHAEILSAIAADTGGQSFATNVPNEQLRTFFIEQLISALKGFSPQLVGYRFGAVGSAGRSAESFAINATPRKLAFKLSWDRGSEFNLRIERNGSDVTAMGRMVTGPFYSIWVADTGQGGKIAPQGNWRMLISAKATTPYQAAALADEHDLDLNLSLNAGVGKAGEPLLIEFQMLRDGEPDKDALDVHVTLRVPKVSTGTLIATGKIDPDRLPKPVDPRASPGERRLNALLVDPQFASRLRPGIVRGRLEHAGKGVYRGSFIGTEVPGTYSVTVEAAGPDGSGGQVHRQASRAVNLRFSGGVAALSDLNLQSRISARERLVTVSMRPQDKHGNYLGPDRSNAISVTSGKTKSVSVRRIIDHGDGRYDVVLGMAADAKPRITLSVAGSVLFSGWLDGIGKK